MIASVTTPATFEVHRRMRYAEHRPAPDLAPWVECLWSLEDGPAVVPRRRERVVPDGCLEIVIHAGPRFHAWESPARRVVQPRAFVVGQLTRPLVLEPGAEIDTFGIRLRPAGARAILDVPLSELTDRVTPLEDVFGAAGAAWTRRLGSCAATAQRREIAERFLRARLARGRRGDDAVRHAVGRVLAERGDVRVARLARDLGWSTRRLERRFAEHVGVPPKKLARIVRVNAILLRMRQGRTPVWSDWALDLGYADQSHLVREFGALVGATPSDSEAIDGMAAFFTSAARLAAYFADA